MPAFDGTGPRGIGAGSGWGMGPCRGTGRVGRGYGGGGYGRGYGGGAGYGVEAGTVPWGNGWTRENELEMLRREVADADRFRKDLERRIADLEAEATKDETV